MNYFDAHTWIGRWPFAFCDVHSPATLSTHLKKHGIRQALVSPLDAVFAPEPGPANADLLRETRGLMALHPVPVINPALGNWREELANAAGDPRVRAVRLLPNYHNYRLKLRAVDELMQAALERGLRVIIQARLIDERHEYHAMMIKGVPVKELDTFLQLHAKTPVLVSDEASTAIRGSLLGGVARQYHVPARPSSGAPAGVRLAHALPHCCSGAGKVGYSCGIAG